MSDQQDCNGGLIIAMVQVFFFWFVVGIAIWFF